MASKSNESFEVIWREWLGEASLNERLRDHVAGRQPFLDFVEGYIRRAQEAKCGSPVRVLEVGCGTAIDSLHLATRVKADFYASDLSEDALRVAQRFAKEFSQRPHLLAGDLRSLSFADGTFDVVFSQGVLEHFPDPVPAITEQARIVTNSGFLIIDVPQKYNPYTLWKGYLLRRGRWPYGWETQYSPGELKHLGVRCGLQPVGVGSWGDTVAYSFRMRSKLLGFLDHLTQFYFRALNALVPSLRPYYRQNVTVCFRQDGDRASMRCRS